MLNLINNHMLVSHHYLEELRETDEYQEEAASLIDGLRGWVDGWDDSTLDSLTQTQVIPTLVSLNYFTEPGSDLHVLQLFPTYAKETPIGLCYVAKLKDEADTLDTTTKGRHYDANIVHALQAADLSWGLLTDGRHWRLYHADELAPYETYLEIDLELLLRGTTHPHASEAAQRFYQLFRAEALTPEEDGSCALDQVLKASEKATAEIEDHLSECIEDVMRDLCQGFLELDGRDTYTAEQRDEVFYNATVLLYRMLFIFYAEARELLPLGDPAYDPWSLDRLVDEAIDRVAGQGMPDPNATDLWQRLLNLSSWISSGNDPRNIPGYNGRLFDDSDKQYIHDHTIANKYLAPALFSLGTIESDTVQGYKKIEYRDLVVRHLGNIYEGLLEYKLFIARERRIHRADGKGGYTFPKLSETRLKRGEENNVLDVGEVYFAQSAGERKAQGAFYTPEYIVDYIVKSTVRRGLEERRESLETQLSGWLDELRAAPPAERANLQRIVDRHLVDFVEEEVLTFRVCDPAMGSGHFLVNVAHTITNFIVETLNLTPWENPEVDSNPVIWRRKVAKSCLYGVDLNELAVELAKLSIWLTTVAKGQPLSFFDHHLRHGNSLIGTRLKDFGEILERQRYDERDKLSDAQISMYAAYPEFRESLSKATNLVQRISAQVADAAGDVKAQASEYERVRCELKPYRDLANLVTARRLGLEIDSGQLNNIAQCLLKSELQLSEEYLALLDQAQKFIKGHKPFHWDLEFPEIFTDLRPDTVMCIGFNTLVGNPPYDVLAEKELKRPVAVDKKYFEEKSSFAPAIGRKLNLYRLFLCAGIELTQAEGRLSFIIPMSILANLQTEPLRRFLFKHFQFETIDAFPQKDDPHKRVFFEAKLPTCVMVLQKSEPRKLTRLSVHPGRRLDEVSKSYSFFPGQIREFDPDHFSVPLVSQEEWELAIRLERHMAFSRLGEIAESKQGEVNLTSDRDYLSDSPPGKEIIRGANIGPYQIYAKAKQGSPMYLDVGSFLADSEPGSKAFDYQYERLAYQNSAALGNYRRLIGTIVPKGNFCSHSVSYFTESDYPLRSLLTLFNSRVADWRFRLTSTSNFVSAYEVETIPVPRFGFSDEFSKSENRDIKELYKKSYRLEDMRFVLDWVLARFDDFETQTVNGQETQIYDGEICLLLSFLADQLLDSYKRQYVLEDQVDILRFVDRDQAFVSIGQIFTFNKSCRTEWAMDLEVVHHDIDGLRLVPNGNVWTLQLQVKLRDPDYGWKDWVKEEDGHTIKRQWISIYRLHMSEEKARFYRYALPRLQDFANARSFPGGYTRSTLKKLRLTKVPMMPDVDLSELVRLDQELQETKRRIKFTDDLIDRIVYKLYGLTEEEIALVEGRV